MERGSIGKEEAQSERILITFKMSRNVEKETGIESLAVCLTGKKNWMNRWMGIHVYIKMQIRITNNHSIPSLICHYHFQFTYFPM